MSCRYVRYTRKFIADAGLPVAHIEVLSVETTSEVTQGPIVGPDVFTKVY